MNSQLALLLLLTSFDLQYASPCNVGQYAYKYYESGNFGFVLSVGLHG